MLNNNKANKTTTTANSMLTILPETFILYILSRFPSFGKESQYNATWAHLLDGVDGLVFPPVLLEPVLLISVGFGGGFGGFVDTDALVNCVFALFPTWVSIFLAAAAAGFPFCVLAPPSDLFVFPS